MSAGISRTRGLLARLQNMRGTNVPDAPALSLRDPWPGDPSRGARLVKGELEFLGTVRPLANGAFAAATGAALARAHILGFSWLRDLRALGTDAARGAARRKITEFLDTPQLDPMAHRPDVAGARIAAWLGHYDFFAASADDDFRQRLMARLVTDARSLSAALPAEARDGRALTALKGLIAAAVAMPDHAAYLPRAQKFLAQEIERQILPDGSHIERSPAALLAALQDFTEIRALFQAGREDAPETLAPAIERMATALRALRHGDGGLALFNGTKEDLPTLIDLVLSQAGRPARAPANRLATPAGSLPGGSLPAASLPAASLAGGSLYRLAAGKSLLLVDAGAPAAPGLDRFAHAGTLAFEFSAGKERLIVNCGAAPAAGEKQWRDALRATAAHSTLIIADVSSSELRDSGLGRRPLLVKTEHQQAGGAHWLATSHDGWGKIFGAIHHRQLYLSESGEDLRGDDLIEAAQPQPFMIRFHLHPSVTASLQQDNGAVLLRLPSGQGWRLRAEGAAISIEESVYFGLPEPRRAEQIVLAGHQDGPQQVKWAITKLR
jgi:uncharacterized heparinase superfamily protein